MTGTQIDESMLVIDPGASFTSAIAGGASNSAFLTFNGHAPGGRAAPWARAGRSPSREPPARRSRRGLQIQGSAPTLAGSSTTTSTVTVPASATLDRVAHAEFRGSVDGGKVTTMEAELFTSWLGGGTCLARVGAYQNG